MLVKRTMVKMPDLRDKDPGEAFLALYEHCRKMSLDLNDLNNEVLELKQKFEASERLPPR